MKSAKKVWYWSFRNRQRNWLVPDKIAPKEPEHISCDICMKEVPIDEANSFEAVDYVIHFCGLECFEKWKQKNQSQQEGDN